jgi:hypothetical protein
MRYMRPCGLPKTNQDRIVKAEKLMSSDPNIQLDYRFGGGDLNKINASAAELVTLAPELIYAMGLPEFATYIQAIVKASGAKLD